MPLYMVQVAYTSQSWKTQIENPSDARARIKGVAESLGGRFIEAYYSFGDHDLVILAEFPDNLTVAAVSLTASAGGALSSIKTTPLLTIEEGRQALEKAAKAAPGYKAPVR
jgi:uncharacterized protein with GYD domain